VWFYAIGSILAVVFGYMAKNEIDRSGGFQQGRGMAIAGIVLGWVGIGITVTVTAILIVSAVASSSSSSGAMMVPSFL
jgi:hypothetical protein